MSRRLVGAILPVVALVAACSDDHATPSADAGATYTREQLLDPQTCNECHQDYFKEWASSMHAYASYDPVFRAMNARGQRETHGELGDFCVKCHAPMAVEENATADGTNLDSVAGKLQGVTCYFCHNVTEVLGTHNSPLKLANDTTMRGGIKNAVPYKAHHSEYSELHDQAQFPASSSLCGSCHDINVPAHFAGATSDAGAPKDVAIERTYQEWRSSVFAPPDPNSAPIGALPPQKSCGDCHMDSHGGPGTIANIQSPFPKMQTYTHRHLHTFAAVDTVPNIVPFLDKADGGDPSAQARAEHLGDTYDFLQRDPKTQLDEIGIKLSSELRVGVCVSRSTAAFQVTLENRSAGHNFPSGASQDRRLWVEWHAYQGTGAQEHEIASGGVVPPGTPVTSIDDQSLFLLRDETFKADGKTPAHMFWDVAKIDSHTAPVATFSSTNGNIAYQLYTVLKRSQLPDRLTITLWLEPVGLDVLDDLISTEDVDVGASLKKIRAAMPRYPVGQLALPNSTDAGPEGHVAIEWTLKALLASQFAAGDCAFFYNTP